MDCLKFFRYCFSIDKTIYPLFAGCRYIIVDGQMFNKVHIIKSYLLNERENILNKIFIAACSVIYSFINLNPITYEKED